MIEKYLESKKFAWSQTTLRSERHRLNSVIEYIDGYPEKLWNVIQGQKPYSRVTLWTRVSQYWQFVMEENKITGPNPYQKWRKANARLFKNCYQKTKPQISFQGAKALIDTLSNKAVREKAHFILNNGLRISECETGDGSHRVIGKGNKPREIFGNNQNPGTKAISNQTLSRHLRTLDLKPHDLRKIFLSRLVELGANSFELCEIAGWSSIETATSYINVNKEKLKELVSKL